MLPAPTCILPRAAPAVFLHSCRATPLLTCGRFPPSLHSFFFLSSREQLIYDKETGRSKGFGFVSFEDDRDARDALNDAGGRDLDGAAIKVNIAHGPATFPPFAGRGRGR